MPSDESEFPIANLITLCSSTTGKVGSYILCVCARACVSACVCVFWVCAYVHTCFGCVCACVRVSCVSACARARAHFSLGVRETWLLLEGFKTVSFLFKINFQTFLWMTIYTTVQVGIILFEVPLNQKSKSLIF